MATRYQITLVFEAVGASDTLDCDALASDLFSKLNTEFEMNDYRDFDTLQLLRGLEAQVKRVLSKGGHMPLTPLTTPITGVSVEIGDFQPVEDDLSFAPDAS